MSRNIMKEIAKLLNLEPGEEFEILNSGYIYKIDENEGLMHRRLSDNFWHNSSTYDFENLLTGKNEIIKLPWTPKEDDMYYYPAEKFNAVYHSIWRNSVFGFALKEAGMIFKTYEECKAALPELKKKYLGVD